MTETKISSEAPVEMPGEQGSSSAGRKVDPGFKRNMAIIGGVVGVAVIAIFAAFSMRSDKSNDQSGSVSMGMSSNATATNDQEPMSPAMRDAIQQKMMQEKAAAAKAGEKVFLNNEFVEKPVSIDPRQELQANNNQGPGAQGQGAPAVAQVIVYTPEEMEIIARRKAGLERQVGSLLQTVDLNRAVPARTTFSAVAAASQTAPGPGQANSTASPAGAPNTASVRFNSNELVGGLEIVPAETASPIDSYKTNFASARIVSGKLAGAYLVGSISQQEDGLRINYTQMRFNGKSYAINAIALDEKTSTNAMAANVDYRYLQRYVFPVTTAVLGGFAAASSQVGSTTQTTGAGTGQEVVRPAPSLDQARAAGVTAGLGIVARQVEREATKPYQIKLEDRTFIGILFIAPVQADPASNNAPAPAPAQVVANVAPAGSPAPTN